MSRGDLDWLVATVGLSEDLALDVLDAADWAEMQRLVDIYGYPKDNAVPPELRERLLSEVFVAAILSSASEKGEEVEEACRLAVKRAQR
jgi:hypothetical protein